MVEIAANVPQHETVIFAHKKLRVESLGRADSLEVFLFVLGKVLHGLVADQSSEHQLCLATFIQRIDISFLSDSVTPRELSLHLILLLLLCNMANDVVIL